jgi:hypothetical protein
MSSVTIAADGDDAERVVAALATVVEGERVRLDDVGAGQSDAAGPIGLAWTHPEVLTLS